MGCQVQVSLLRSPPWCGQLPRPSGRIPVYGIAHVLVGIIVVASAACAAAVTGPAPTPTGATHAEHWTFPLVGPLEDDLLITAVKVRGHGPYLFAIDPDANLTVIDEEVVEDAGLSSSAGPDRVDENGARQARG